MLSRIDFTSTFLGMCILYVSAGSFPLEITAAYFMLSIYTENRFMKKMKEKIAYYARKLFDEHGYHGAALRDVCKLAGCKMPTIYYYFENNEKLFDEAVRVAFEELVASASSYWKKKSRTN